MRLVKSILLWVSKYSVGVILGCLAFAVPLAGYMINGSAMRYSGDDYCYAKVLTANGFWKTQWISYTQVQPYNGNRYSLTLFYSLNGLVGPLMSGALPALAILAWLVGIVFTIRLLTRVSRIRLGWMEIVLVAEALVFFTLFMAPSLSQSLYWQSGMLTYLAPLVANTYLFGLILFYSMHGKPDLLILGLIGFLAVLAGGFSEAATMLQLGYLSLLLLALLLPSQRKNKRSPRALHGIWVAWSFSIVAAILLAISPSNAADLEIFSRPGLLDLFSIALNSTLAFIKASLHDLVLPNLIVFVFSIGLGWLIQLGQAGSLHMTFRKWIRAVILLGAASLILIFACTLPSAYIQSGSPELRALITARFVMVLAIGLIGGMTGLWLTSQFPITVNLNQYSRLAPLILLVIVSLYPIYSARNIYNEISSYQRWASFWDDRDASLRLASQENVHDVEVIKLDHIIQNVAELSEDPTYWYNTCAAGYYGVQSIRADLPGWDTP